MEQACCAPQFCTESRVTTANAYNAATTCQDDHGGICIAHNSGGNYYVTDPLVDSAAFGNEWDWMRAFWDIYKTTPGASNPIRLSVPEIVNIINLSNPQCWNADGRFSYINFTVAAALSGVNATTLNTVMNNNGVNWNRP